jgi:hypothetical protein
VSLAVRMAIGLVLVFTVVTGAGAYSILDDFESYDYGTFPSPTWLDVGVVDPTPPNPPDPSCVVERRTDAFGQQTKALFLGDFFAPSSGIYAFTPIDRYYDVTVDVRVDRFSDLSNYPFSDYPVSIGPSVFEDGVDPAFWNCGQIYASVLTKTWRLYVIGPNVFQDIELGLPVNLGFWQTVELAVDTQTGSFRSRIWDVASGDLLLDRTDLIPDWTPAEGQYDTVSIFEGELTQDATIPNLTNVDNVSVNVVPEPAMFAVIAGGVLSLVAWRRRRA